MKINSNTFEIQPGRATTKTYHGGTEAVNKPSMTNFHKFSGDPKCIPTSQRSFIGHLNDKFFVAKPSYSFDSGFIHSFTETRRKTRPNASNFTLKKTSKADHR